MVLGQLEPVSLLNLVVNGGAFVLIAYLIIYGLPALHKKISDDSSAERKTFTDALADDRQAFSDAIATDRKAFAETLQAERRESVEALTEKRREFLADQKETRDTFAVLARDMMKTYRDESIADRAACDKHFETLAGSMAKGNEATMAAIRTMAEQMQSHMARGQQWEQMLREANLKKDEAETQLKQQQRSPEASK